MSRQTIWITAIMLLALQTWSFCKSTSVSPNDLGTRVVLHGADILASIFTTCLFAAVPAALISFIPFRRRKYWLKFKRIFPIAIGCVSALLIIISFFSDRLGQPGYMKAVPVSMEKRMD